MWASEGQTKRMASYPDFLSAEQRQELKAGGVTGTHASWYFAEAGITDPEQMILLFANGVRGEDDDWYFYHFTEAGITARAQMLHLFANQVYGWDADSFTKAGIIDHAQMIDLKAKGLTGPDAEYFTAAGITDLDQMFHLKAHGVDGLDAAWFSQAGITDHAQMIDLKAKGLTGWAAAGFAHAGVTDPGQMLAFTRLEVAPEDLDRIPAARNRSGDEIVDRVLSAGVRLGRPPNGVLTGLSRSTKIATELTELSDEALDVTITLTEDEFDATGDISAARIRETLNIIH